MALGLAVLVLVLYLDDPTRDRQTAQAEPETEVQEIEEAAAVPLSAAVEPPKGEDHPDVPDRSEPVPDADEHERIEAALVEQGYFREDIPLSFEEQDFLHTACEEFAIQYELAVAVIWKETNFRNIMGDSGKSYGYMQIKKGCHENRMAELGVTDLMDPYSNFRVGCHYLAELLEKYDGNVEMALMAYNAGSGNANKWWFSQGVYSNEYSRKVLNYMEGL